MEWVNDVCQLLSRINKYLTLDIFPAGAPRHYNQYNEFISCPTEWCPEIAGCKNHLANMKLSVWSSSQKSKQSISCISEEQDWDSTAWLHNRSTQEKREGYARCTVKKLVMQVLFSFSGVKTIEDEYIYSTQTQTSLDI